MAWRRPGDKPLSEPMMVSLLTHICVTRPQFLKNKNNRISDISNQIQCYSCKWFFYYDIYIHVYISCLFEIALYCTEINTVSAGFFHIRNRILVINNGTQPLVNPWRKNKNVSNIIMFDSEEFEYVFLTRWHNSKWWMKHLAKCINTLDVLFWAPSQNKDRQSSASLAFVWGIHRWPVNSPHK